MLVEDYLRPAAVKVGILSSHRDDEGKLVDDDPRRFGFHSLRHSLASFLVRIRTDPKTVQTLLRHSDVKLTLQCYTPQCERGSHGCGRGNASLRFSATLPPPRPPVVTTFVPYIYSRTEIRLLLSTVRSSQEKSGCKIHVRTLRTFLLFPYGTGALVGEARRLLREDVDFKRRTIILRSNRFNRSREIPIGPDLYKVLRRYHTTNHRKGEMNAPQFFLTKEGNPLKGRAACQTFQRLRRMAGTARDDGARYQPRLHDLRQYADSRIMPNLPRLALPSPLFGAVSRPFLTN